MFEIQSFCYDLRKTVIVNVSNLTPRRNVRKRLHNTLRPLYTASQLEIRYVVKDKTKH